MIKLAPFSQGRLLHNADTITRDGVCAALADYWLKHIKQHPRNAASERMSWLKKNFSRVMRHQRHYASLYAGHRKHTGDPDLARVQVGHHAGLAYTEQTEVLRVRVSFDALRSRLAADIARPGDAATWALRFADGTGHALAGYCSFEHRQHGLERLLHLFDPNNGEYTGSPGDWNAILNHLFTQEPGYYTIESIERIYEGRG